MPVSPFGKPIPLSLDIIEEIARQAIESLEADALRTIRQSDLDKGKNLLERVEGVRRLLEDLRLAANSSYYRQLREASDRSNFIQNRIAQIKRKR